MASPWAVASPPSSPRRRPPRPAPPGTRPARARGDGAAAGALLTVLAGAKHATKPRPAREDEITVRDQPHCVVKGGPANADRPQRTRLADARPPFGGPACTFVCIGDPPHNQDLEICMGRAPATRHHAGYAQLAPPCRSSSVRDPLAHLTSFLDMPTAESPLMATITRRQRGRRTGHRRAARKLLNLTPAEVSRQHTPHF